MQSKLSPQTSDAVIYLVKPELLNTETSTFLINGIIDKLRKIKGVVSVNLSFRT
jgi:hypothetical protein